MCLSSFNKPLREDLDLRQASTISVAVWLVLASHGVSLANGIVRDSLGAVPSGRGGANVAHDDNLGTLHDNPAAVAWSDDALRFSLNGDLLLRDVYYRDPLDSGRSRDGAYVLPQLSVAASVPGTPVSFGLGMHLPGGYGVSYELRHPVLGKQDYESQAVLLKLLPVVACRIGERVSVGGGLGVGYAKCRFELPYTFQRGPLAGLTGLAEADADGFGVTGNLGIQIRPTERLTLGLAWVSGTLTRQTGEFDLDVSGVGLPVTDPTARYDLEYDFRWPASITGGAAYGLPRGRLSAEVAWFGWRSALDRFHFRLKNGDNPEFDALVGSTPSDTFPLDWRDSVSVRLGYEHFLTDATAVRLGYIYNLNPIPDNTLTPLLPGVLEHSVTVGAGHRIGGAQLDFAYQYAFGRTREVGSSRILGGDFDSSRVQARAHWVFVGLSWRFR